MVHGLMGRPTKFTPERTDRLLDALRGGNTRRASCLLAGIGVQTLDDWQHRFPYFREAIEKAEAEAEVAHVANIVRAAQDGVWTASAWWLERRRPDDYGRVDRVELTLRQTAERLGAELGISPEELIAEAERIVRAH